jgi:sterol desaturase/sphingolipid hydroxylase (fatty acid hydroxylase superfamily)
MAHPRKQTILDAIPEAYSPLLHLTLTVGSGILMLVLAAFMIEGLTFGELLTVPAMWIVANLGEWFAHKYILHRRVRGMTVLYDQHTPRHHVIYPHDGMAIESRRELLLVLIPPFGVAMITLSVSPWALAAGYLLTPNAGWLVLVAVALYTVCYEVTHLLYHLPEDHLVTRSSLVRFLREHHLRHHDPRLMRRWNFNVTLPLWDVILGTRITDTAWAAHLESPGAADEARAPESGTTAAQS